MTRAFSRLEAALNAYLSMPDEFVGIAFGLGLCAVAMLSCLILQP